LPKCLSFDPEKKLLIIDQAALDNLLGNNLNGLQKSYLQPNLGTVKEEDSQTINS
jgi:hypothetical protein